jgi:hypothetical protein
MKPIQLYNFKPLLWLGFAAITLRPFLIWGYSKDKVPAHLMRHELVHYAQQKRLGFKFYYLYLKEYFTRLYFNMLTAISDAHWDAYSNISFEVEARKAEWPDQYIFTASDIKNTKLKEASDKFLHALRAGFEQDK